MTECCVHRCLVMLVVRVNMCVCVLAPEYEKATSEKEMRGGDMFPASANLNLNMGSVRGREERGKGEVRGKMS